jgi:hypothetical protein
MRQVFRAVFHPLTIVWSVVLLHCFADVRFPAALLVGVIGVTLINMLLRRVGRALVRLLFALAVIATIVVLLSNDAVREAILKILDGVVPRDCAHMIILALLFTIGYAVLRWTQPAPQHA